jgi:hypothetical protein
MHPLEIYKKFLLKVNKNDTNGYIKVPKSQFVLIFNEEKRKYLQKALDVKESSIGIEDLEELLVVDKPLDKVDTYTLKVDFKLPENYLKSVSSYVIASKGSCNGVVLYNWFVKPKDINVLLQNYNQRPSFEYQETLMTINNSLMSVYKTDFNIDEVYYTYYREPKDLDIEGYTHIDGTPSTNVYTDFADINIEAVIDCAVTEALRNYESTEQLQIALQRQQASNIII